MRWIPPFLILFVAATCSASAQQTYPYPTSASHPQTQQVNPASLLEKGLNELILFMKQSQEINRKQLTHYINQQVAPNFDFIYMARISAGRFWRHMDQEHRAKQTRQIQQDFLATMISRLGDYSGQGARVIRTRHRGENEAMVAVIVDNPRGYPAKLSFRFLRSDKGWRVIDVSANGSSALAHYRLKFRDEMIAQQRQSMGTSPWQGRQRQPMPPR